MSIEMLVPWLLVVPLAAAITTLLVPVRMRAPLSLMTCVPMISLTVALLIAVRREGMSIYAFGGWEAPLGIPFMVDGLAAGMALLTALISAACAVHAQTYLRDQASANAWFWPLLWFMWTALNGLWLSADLFNLYVCLELLGLSAVGLVALRGTPEALSAAIRYLLAALLGSLVYLLGIALLYGSYGTLALTELTEILEAAPTVFVALALMAAGLTLKTALFPLHSWLPSAHGGALTPVSALLSALVIKASLYVLIRLWLYLASEIGPPVGAATVLGLFGAGAVLWGSWMAWRQEKLKYLVAYSTVAQVGYLFLFFPLVTSGSTRAAGLAYDGFILMLLSHALAKAAMFLSAGNLILAVGGERVRDLAGINRIHQTSMVSFGIAGVGIMGLPPSGGFTAKWLYLQSALLTGQWVWIAVLLAGTVLSAMYIFRVFHQAYLDGPPQADFNTPPIWLEASAMFLALASVLIGLTAWAPLEWMRVPTFTGAV